jgi:hypothetical protein
MGEGAGVLLLEELEHAKVQPFVREDIEQVIQLVF